MKNIDVKILKSARTPREHHFFSVNKAFEIMIILDVIMSLIYKVKILDVKTYRILYVFTSYIFYLTVPEQNS